MCRTANPRRRTEHLAVRRRDVDGAEEHAAWSLQLTGGLGGSVALGAGWAAGLDLLLIWNPTARRLAVLNGPSTRLDDAGIRLALSLAWGGDPLRRVLDIY